MENFQLYIFSGNEPVVGYEREWEAAYLTWKSVWEEAFKGLGVNKKVFSDDFTRTKDVLALFDGEKCVMVLFFRPSPMNLITSRDDSYFECWDSDSIGALCRDSLKVGITNYVTIPEFCRGNYKGIRLKNLMMMFIQCYVSAGSLAALAGTTRNDRGIDKATESVGATVLEKTKLYDVDVNLIAFYKNTMMSWEPQISSFAQSLWEKRIDHKLIGKNYVFLRAA